MRFMWLFVSTLLIACNGGQAPSRARVPRPEAVASQAPPRDVEPGEPITLAFGGDTMLARLVDQTVRREGPAYVWGEDVSALLRDADLALVNLECVIASGGAPFRPRRVFYFRASPSTVEVLRVAGIDYVSLANNHALDYGPDALLESIRRLDEAGIAHAGAGANLAAARRFAMLRAGGLTVGVVSFADHFDLYAATEDRPGTNVISIDERGLEAARAAIRATRRAGADLVVFSIHWGPNMNVTPRPGFPEFARAVLDAGADVFHGHSAHVFQGVEIHDGKPILYDTGDLLDDYRVHPDLRNDLQLLFLVEVDRGGARRVELVPLRIDRMRVRLARGRDHAWIARRVTELSRPMGTRVNRHGERLRIDVRR